MSGKPVILYDQVAVAIPPAPVDPIEAQFTGGITALAGFPLENAFSPFTYPADSFMVERGTTTGSVLIYLNGDIDSSDFDALAFVINGLEGDSVTVDLSYFPTGGGSETILKSQSVSRDGCHLMTFTKPAGPNFWRITFSGIAAAQSDSTPISIPVIMVGKLMQFEKCIRNRYAPLDYNRKTEFLTNESGTGQYIGRSIIRRNHESTVSFDLMTAPWVRSTFQPFVRHARTKPYFFAWNPTTYPDEVNYVWTDEDIGVEYTGDRNRMSASWSMRGLGNDQE